MERYILYFLVLPLASAVLMPFASRVHRRLADMLAVVTALGLVALSIGFIPFAGQTLTTSVFDIHLAMDGLSLLFLVIISSVGAMCLLYATEYVGHLGGRAKFYALFLLLMLGLNGVVLVRDLFSLYVYLEVASIASYMLVAFNLEYDGIESALKYLLLSVVGTGLVLFGISLVYMNTGTLQFDGLKAFFATTGFDGNPVFVLVSALFVVGFGLKAAMMPFHAWLPDAHPSAPAPVSAILSGVVIKVAGVYSMIRIFYGVFPISARMQTVFLVLGGLSMVAGAIVAYFQTDIKRMLAYSSISQIGYILIGLGIGNELAILGALFHAFNHAVFKSLLFLNSGALQFRLHTREMDEMGGLEGRMPITGVTSVFGTLSIAGIPPFNGFWSKLLIIMGALAAKMYFVATLAIVMSIFTLGYFLVIQRKVFFGKLNIRWKDIREVPAAMSFAMILLAAECLLVGLFFGGVLSRLVEPAAKFVLGGN